MKLLSTALATVLLLAPVASRQLTAVRVGPGDDLQAAIDAARPGDIILLAPGAVFLGTFTLRAHDGAAFITLRTDGPGLPEAGARTGPEYAGRLAVLQSRTNAPALRTAPRAHHWRIENVEFRANRRGAGEIIALGDGGPGQHDLTDVPHDLVLDRVYVNGDPVAGQKRGIALNSASTEIINSYIAGIRAVGMDSQAIGGWNGPGPFRIENNYVEGAGENLMFGGADPAIPDLVPSGIVVRKNHFAKPLSWRDPVIQPPNAVRAATSETGGSLDAGTYIYSVVAEHPAAGTEAARSAPSQPASADIGGAGGTASVTVGWEPVPEATAYRVYRRAPDGGELVWRTTATTFVDTGTGGEPGRPRARASFWTVKNLFELKNARDVLVDGNVFERNWKHAQTGSAILIKPENQNGRAPWTTIENVRFTNNVVRHSGSAINLAGMDHQHPSQRARGIVIRRNVFADIDGGTWGGDGTFLRIGGGPIDVVVEDNSVMQTGKIIDVYPGKTAKDAPGFVFRGNLLRHNRYGVKGTAQRTGTPTLAAFFPGGIFVGNVIAGGDRSKYPAGNEFVSEAEFARLFAERTATTGAASLD